MKEISHVTMRQTPEFCKEYYASGKLVKITRTKWHETGLYGYYAGERVKQHALTFETIWKRGWHHIKGARKQKK